MSGVRGAGLGVKRNIGERNHRSKLTDDDVVRMRALRCRGVELKDLAVQFGVSVSAVHAAVTRLTWRHVA